MESKSFYAMKMLKSGFSLSDLRSFISEVETLAKLCEKSSKVPKLIDVNFRGSYHKPGNPPIKICYYVMELAEYGELFKLVKEGPSLAEEVVRFIFKRLFFGMPCSI